MGDEGDADLLNADGSVFEDDAAFGANAEGAGAEQEDYVIGSECSTSAPCEFECAIQLRLQNSHRSRRRASQELA